MICLSGKSDCVVKNFLLPHVSVNGPSAPTTVAATSGLALVTTAVSQLKTIPATATLSSISLSSAVSSAVSSAALSAMPAAVPATVPATVSLAVPATVSLAVPATVSLAVSSAVSSSSSVSSSSQLSLAASSKPVMRVSPMVASSSSSSTFVTPSSLTASMVSSVVSTLKSVVSPKPPAVKKSEMYLVSDVVTLSQCCDGARRRSEMSCRYRGCFLSFTAAQIGHSF